MTDSRQVAFWTFRRMAWLFALCIGVALVVVMKRSEPAHGQPAQESVARDVAPRSPRSAVLDAARSGLRREVLSAVRQRSTGERVVDAVRPDPARLPTVTSTGSVPTSYLQRYGGRTVPMSPSLTHQAPAATVRIASRGPEPKLTVWLPSTRVLFGERTVLFAELVTEAGAPLVPATLKAIVRPAGQPEFAFQQNLEASADGVPNRYSTPILLEPERYRSLQQGSTSAPIAMEYAVEASGTYRGQPYQRRAVGSFFIHQPNAELVASSARVDKHTTADGSDLLLNVDIHVAKRGTYWAGAELWADERPVAQAQLRLGELEPGDYPVVLLFGGQVLRDSELDGPYTVRNVRLNQVDSVPPQEATPIAELEPTPAWQASEFR